MIIIIRTKEDANALYAMTEEYILGASLTIVNTTKSPIEFYDSECDLVVINPGTNKEIPR